MKPTITVGVPCFNYGRFLPHCIASLIGQEGVALDIVIIDDASTDETPVICAAAQALYPQQVRIIRHTENHGYIRTFNECIAETRSTYFTIVSADDMLTPGSLARACQVMELEPSVGLVYGPTICIDEKGRRCFGLRRGRIPIPKVVGRSYTRFPGHTWLDYVCNSGRCFILGSEAVVRSDVQLAAGGYDKLVGHASDAENWLRIAAISDVAFVPSEQLMYRVHSASMTRTVHAGFAFDIEARRDAFNSAYRKGAICDIQHEWAMRAIVRLQARGPELSWWQRNIAGRLRFYFFRFSGIE